MTEAQVKRQVVHVLGALGAVIDVTHDAKHRPATRGVPDIIAALPGGRTLWIECKGENGRVSEEQLSFIARLRANGHTAIVVCSWDDLERHL